MTHARFRAALLALSLALSGAAAAGTSLTYTSPAGEPLGEGVGTRTLSAPDEVRVTGSQPDHIMVELRQGDESFSIQFRAPLGQFLRRGSFTLAEHAAHATGRSPGLEILSHGGVCDVVWGSFKIRQLDRDEFGQVSRLDATFVHRCGSATAPALTGTLYVETGPRYFSYSHDAGFPLAPTVASRSYYGETSDTYLGGGQSAFTYSVTGQRDMWYLAFSPPYNQKFAKGTYDLFGYNSTNGAGLYMSKNGPESCVDYAGKLTVRDIRYNEGGGLEAIHATFWVTCDGAAPVFRGTIRHGL